MTKIITTAKISIGNRIALTQETCELLKVKQGDKVLIKQSDSGEIVISPAQVA
ncbi:hypothetical protein [Candidatus Methanomethylophilus sp. 1R26]|uniref:hypothetical protein n=1 Tax=Candidatus Methanomethylophilus sp. 1R26 TaxID=1769296 RepID=UPI0012FEB0F8|nr:hypothetical protein [Candidatus Methanomethylophilus sp. 1R26]